MTGEVKKNPAVLGVVVGMLSLFGTGVAAYTNIKSDQASMKTDIEVIKLDVRDLDDYDIHLTEVTDSLRGQSIRTETELANWQRTTEKLEETMDAMLKEVRLMNDNLIKIRVRNGEG